MSEKAKTQLTEKEKVELREQAKKMAMDEFGLKEDDVKLLEEAMEEAKLPVELDDKDFKMGERELDIRKLSKKNLDQMMFRMQILNVTYLRQLTQTLVDTMQLIMLVLKQLGCEDIIKSTEELIEEMRKNVTKDKN